MTIERIVRLFAGSFVLASLALGAPASPLFVSTYFLWLAVFAGANLAQSALTGFCPLESILRRMGVGSAQGRAPAASRT